MYSTRPRRQLANKQACWLTSHQCGHHAGVEVVSVGQGGGGVQRGRRGHEVWRVAVGQESPWAQRKGPRVVVQGERLRHLWVLLQHGRLLALLVLVGDFSVACLDAVLLHGERPVHLEREGRGTCEFHSVCGNNGCPASRMTHVVQFVVESTGVTHWLPAGVAPPQCCRAGVTVGTQCAGSLADNLTRRQSLLKNRHLSRQLREGPQWNIPVSSWAGSEVGSGRSSCGTARRRYTGSDPYHPDATGGWLWLRS